MWNSSEYAEYYELKASKNSNFDSLFIDTTRVMDTSFTFVNEGKLSPFYWKVRAINKSGESAWSDSVFVETILTVVNSSFGEIPKRFYVMQNYPNPFNPITVIQYGLAEAAKVNIDVYNILGEKVGELLNMEQEAGNYRVEFNGRDLPSGIYFYRLKADGIRTGKQYNAIKKMVLLK